MKTRREFVRNSALTAAGIGALTAAGFLLPWKRTSKRAWADTLDPTTIPKYVERLRIPAAMPRISGGAIDYYEVAVRQFRQQVLPASLPMTTLWGYGSPSHPNSFASPARTIEARYNKAVRVKWINGLVNSLGRFRPHLLEVDQTLHWANPPGGISGRDSRGTNSNDYRGPVPIVTHLHGAHDNEYSDGFPEAWYLPAANNLPSGFARVGSYYDQFNAESAAAQNIPSWTLGTATFTYPNDQRATTLWYHDHTLGLTRLNIYAGPVGFYLLRGGPDDLPAGVLPGPAPQRGDPAGTKYFEIPIVIYDRSFNPDGSLFFDDEFEKGFFGETMVANGRTWPFLDVEPRRYRFRFLNACNARFLMLRLVTGDPTIRPATSALPFWQIGSDGGFLPAPAMLETLLLGVAERADVIVDFTGLTEGTEVFLINEGVNQGVDPDETGTIPTTTGQVMKFKVGALSTTDQSTPPSQLTLPTIVPLGPAVTTRDLTLDHVEHEGVGDDEHEMMLLGTLAGGPMMWDDPITETPGLGHVEVWNIRSRHEHPHPIHLHIVQFEVISRTDDNGIVRPPAPGETGFKDTVIVNDDEIVKVKAKFDVPGLFVWHCHILEHEDVEMMRPYRVSS
jgi:spore coat protein A